MENIDYYKQIKEEFISNEIYKRVKDYSKNRKELETYYNVGKLLIEAQGGEERAKYGNELIKEYSAKLTKELGKGYSVTSLKYMRQFYIFQKSQPLVDQLSWTHYQVLLALKDINEINYYIDMCIKNNLSRRDLIERIKNNEYQRLDDKTKNKLINKEETSVTDFVKNPIIINTNGKEIIEEKALKMVILENIPAFLKELGEKLSFIDSEYKVTIGNRNYFIDLLLYNYEFHCFVVIELKAREMAKEDIGQIQIYMNAINKDIKGINDDNTIGIIVCKKDNQLLLSYCSDNRIFATKYVLEGEK